VLRQICFDDLPSFSNSLSLTLTLTLRHLVPCCWYLLIYPDSIILAWPDIVSSDHQLLGHCQLIDPFDPSPIAPHASSRLPWVAQRLPSFQLTRVLSRSAVRSSKSPSPSIPYLKHAHRRHLPAASVCLALPCLSRVTL